VILSREIFYSRVKLSPFSVEASTLDSASLAYSWPRSELNTPAKRQRPSEKLLTCDQPDFRVLLILARLGPDSLPILSLYHTPFVSSTCLVSIVFPLYQMTRDPFCQMGSLRQALSRIRDSRSTASTLAIHWGLVRLQAYSSTSAC